jgi:hypothetical protein
VCGFLIAACTERLDSSGVCSILCPTVGGEVQNITLDAVAFDTTVQSLSGLGAEDGLLLAARGDTLDARVIVRFDSLPAVFIEAGAEKPITFVDSATLRLLLDTLSIKGSAPVTIEAYDVDTTANDTSTAAVLALFRPDRLIASQTFARVELRDTIRYVLPASHVLAKIQAAQRLRIGLRAVSTASTQMTFASQQAGTPPALRFRVAADTAIQPFSVIPLSTTPTDDPVAKANLGDYTVFARRPPEASPSDLVVGGFPPRRTYLRFDIPLNILDSSTVVRATILLNQIPTPLLDPTDSVMIVPQLVLAGVSVTDPTKAAQILTDFTPDSLKARPGESGVRQIEIGAVFGFWRQLKASETPHAIVLRVGREGRSPLEIRFSSLEAAAQLRPRLRISYTNEVPLGLP